MDRIPDADYIREAEQVGIPPYHSPECPVCGCECRDYYFNKWMEIVGCNVCIDWRDAEEWNQDHQDDNRPDWLDE